MNKQGCIACCLSCLLLLTCCQSNKAKEADDMLLGLEWYSSIETVRKAMSAYNFDEEYEETAFSGIQQTLLEYDNVPLYGQNCEELTLCFTSLGLVGINYHDDDGNYTEWRTWLTEKIGEPTEESDMTAAWDPAPLENVDTIYVFRMEDDVQISFFADDTGSETAVSTEALTAPPAEGAYDHNEMPAVNGLQFYADVASTKAAMGRAELDEYEETGSSGYRLTLLDYDDVQLYGEKCDLSLCFTSLGLVGINYSDDDSSLEKWVERLSADYGAPDSQTDGSAVWEQDPLGAGTSIYLLLMEDDVQISFFADDIGSEMAE